MTIAGLRKMAAAVRAHTRSAPQPIRLTAAQLKQVLEEVGVTKACVDLSGIAVYVYDTQEALDAAKLHSSTKPLCWIDELT